MDFIQQLRSFASEILLLIDSRTVISVKEICEKIEEKKICDFIKEEYGFKSLHSKDIIDCKKINDFFYEYAYETDAYKMCIDKNGLVYLVQIILDKTVNILYDIKWNSTIIPEEFI